MTKVRGTYQFVVWVFAKQDYDVFGELGFDSGEDARVSASTFKKGSRRENCSMSIRRCSDEKYRFESLLESAME